MPERLIRIKHKKTPEIRTNFFKSRIDVKRDGPQRPWPVGIFAGRVFWKETASSLCRRKKILKVVYKEPIE